MSEVAWRSVTAAAGVATAVLLIGGVLLYQVPRFDGSPDLIVAAYQRNAATLGWSVRLLLLAVIASLVFAVGLWSILRAVDLRLATLSLIGAAILGVWYILWQGVVTTGVVTAKVDPTADPRPLIVLINVIDQLVPLSIAMWVGPASLAALIGRVFPRWAAWLGLVLAVISILPALTATDYKFPLINLNPIAGLVWLVWLVTVSVVIWRRRHTPQA